MGHFAQFQNKLLYTRVCMRTLYRNCAKVPTLLLPASSLWK